MSKQLLHLEYKKKYYTKYLSIKLFSIFIWQEHVVITEKSQSALYEVWGDKAKTVCRSICQSKACNPPAQ